MLYEAGVLAGEHKAGKAAAERLAKLGAVDLTTFRDSVRELARYLTEVAAPQLEGEEARELLRKGATSVLVNAEQAAAVGAKAATLLTELTGALSAEAAGKAEEFARQIAEVGELATPRGTVPRKSLFVRVLKRVAEQL